MRGHRVTGLRFAGQNVQMTTSDGEEQTEQGQVDPERPWPPTGPEMALFQRIARLEGELATLEAFVRAGDPSDEFVIRLRNEALAIVDHNEKEKFSQVLTRRARQTLDRLDALSNEPRVSGQTVTLTFDLGPAAPLGEVAKVLEDLDVVVGVVNRITAEEINRQANDTEGSVLTRTGLGDVDSFLVIQRITYSNPLDVVLSSVVEAVEALGANGPAAIFGGLLLAARQVTSTRRENSAVRKENAEIRKLDAETEGVRLENEFKRLTNMQISNLTDAEISALLRLADQDPEVEVKPEPNS